jgi:hypothetical protein
MRLLAGLLICLTMAGAARVNAQEPPPPIPRFVVDVHATVPMFPSDSQQLAQSHSLNSTQLLPGQGFGAQLGVHLYLVRWRALTVGIGGEAIVARSTYTPPADAPPDQIAVEERLVSAAPQLSFNFGTGHGWSYLSGGVGRSVLALHPIGALATDADVEPLQTVNYGGGARWFIKNHLAFSLDVRFYEIQPGTSVAPGVIPGSPRMRMVIIGAGVSLK